MQFDVYIQQGLRNAKVFGKVTTEDAGAGIIHELNKELTLKNIYLSKENAFFKRLHFDISNQKVLWRRGTEFYTVYDKNSNMV